MLSGALLATDSVAGIRATPRTAPSISTAKVEPSLAKASPGSRFQFERLGYFCVDPDSTSGALVFNRTVSLRDTWAKIAQKSQ